MFLKSRRFITKWHSRSLLLGWDKLSRNTLYITFGTWSNSFFMVRDKPIRGISFQVNTAWTTAFPAKDRMAKASILQTTLNIHQITNMISSKENDKTCSRGAWCANSIRIRIRWRSWSWWRRRRPERRSVITNTPEESLDFTAASWREDNSSLLKN